MRINKYTEIINYSSQYYLVDFHKMVVVLLNPKLAVLLQDKWTDPASLVTTHKNLYHFLIRKGIIVENTYDDVSSCIRNINQELDSPKNLEITINPTLDCNLRCWYCYESHRKDSVMKKEVLKNTMKFFEKRIELPSVKTVNLSFFGGEPLLGFQHAMLPLLEFVSQKCDLHQKFFSYNITTNATLLSRSRLLQLLGVSNNFHLQIPFDGGKDYHDSTKHYPNGTGSFERVVRNVKFALEHKISTTIRCNYTNDNISSFHSLLDEFKEYSKENTLYISFQKVWQVQKKPETSKVLNDLREHATSLGFHTNLDDPDYRIMRCYADYSDNIVINYNGDVYHCTARNFTSENSEGHINANGDIIPSENSKKRQQKRFLKSCYSCGILPICGVCSQNKLESEECPSGNNDPIWKKQYMTAYFKHNIYPRIKKSEL